jgi:hypothetical protein
VSISIVVTMLVAHPEVVIAESCNRCTEQRVH